jgi:hypothetical protein
MPFWATAGRLPAAAKTAATSAATDKKTTVFSCIDLNILPDCDLENQTDDTGMAADFTRISTPPPTRHSGFEYVACVGKLSVSAEVVSASGQQLFEAAGMFSVPFIL